jgi:ADP-ribose pyrophosphatase
LTHPGAVGILAFDSLGKIILVKQYRYPVGTFTYEIPAGKLSPREAPLACVKRELEEETGFRAQHITKMLSYWPTAAFSNELIHLYIARGLKASRQKPDDDEFLEIVRLSPKQLEMMIHRGKIHDSKTLIAYLAWKSLA